MDETSLKIQTSRGEREYEMDTVFDQKSKQEEVQFIDLICITSSPSILSNHFLTLPLFNNLSSPHLPSLPRSLLSSKPISHNLPLPLSCNLSPHLTPTNSHLTSLPTSLTSLSHRYLKTRDVLLNHSWMASMSVCSLTVKLGQGKPSL